MQKIRIAIIGAITILSILVFKEIIIVLILFFLNLILTLYKKYLKFIPFEFELSTISTAYFSQRYGIEASLAIGFIMLGSTLIYSHRFSAFNILKFLGLFIVAFLSTGSTILLAIIAYEIFLILSYAMLGMNLLLNLSHQASNAAFNIFLLLKYF